MLRNTAMFRFVPVRQTSSASTAVFAVNNNINFNKNDPNALVSSISNSKYYYYSPSSTFFFFKNYNNSNNNLLMAKEDFFSRSWSSSTSSSTIPFNNASRRFHSEDALLGAMKAMNTELRNELDKKFDKLESSVKDTNKEFQSDMKKNFEKLESSVKDTNKEVQKGIVDMNTKILYLFLSWFVGGVLLSGAGVLSFLNWMNDKICSVDKTLTDKMTNHREESIRESHKHRENTSAELAAHAVKIENAAVTANRADEKLTVLMSGEAVNGRVLAAMVERKKGGASN